MPLLGSYIGPCKRWPPRGIFGDQFSNLSACHFQCFISQDVFITPYKVKKLGHLKIDPHTYLKVMTALVIGQPITNEVAVSRVTWK